MIDICKNTIQISALWCPPRLPVIGGHLFFDTQIKRGKSSSTYWAKPDASPHSSSAPTLLRVTTPLSPPLLCFLGHRLALDLSPLFGSPEASLPTQSHTANSYWGHGAERPTMGLHMTNTIIYWSPLLMRFPQPFSTLGMSHWPFFLLSLNLFSFSRSQSSIPQISFPTPHEYLCFLLWLFLVFNM